MQLSFERLDARRLLSQAHIPTSLRGLLSRVPDIDPGVLIILIVYFVWFGFLIIRGHGIPYVMDNNETFSTLNHARNLWTFDFFRSLGLTDEAISPDPGAHPVVHTHQGNFPRLFGVLLYALGARSAASQILITTMTIGTASVLMGYMFFRRLGGRLFASIAILLLMTDYLMFAQWQVNTYRVWQGFLLFAALLCVHGLSGWSRWRWAIATISTYAALFYGELVFAAFVSFAVGFYTVWTYRRAPRLVVMGGLVQAAGATLGLGTLIVQLVLYLGWHDFLTDLRLTLTARNYAPDSADFTAALIQFYGPRNILFLYNVQPEERFLGLFASLRLLFRFVWQTPTPFLSLLGLGMAAASLLADSRRPGPPDVAATAPGLWSAATAQLVPGLFVFIMSIASGNAVVGLPFSGIAGGIETVTLTVGVFFVLAIAFAVGLRICATSISISGTPPRIFRCVLANLFLLCFGLLILAQGEFYRQAAAILWWETLTPFPAWVAKIAACAIAFTGSLLILTGRRALLGRWHDVPSSLFPFLLCGALSYAIVYKLSSGYVFSGYLNRLCPFVVFHADALLALGLFAAIAIALTLLGRTGMIINNRVAEGVGAASAMVALAFVTGWMLVQSRYLQLFPPDRMAFVRLLEGAEFRGKGLISNTYAVPFGYLANTWAYTEANPFALADAPLSSQGNSPRIFHLWLADRRTNPDYLRPDLYVCIDPVSSADSLVAQLATARSGALGCSGHPVVRRALSGRTERTLPNATILARDTVHDRWAILRLEWSSSNW